jgi:hypothetical protein
MSDELELRADVERLLAAALAAEERHDAELQQRDTEHVADTERRSQEHRAELRLQHDADEARRISDLDQRDANHAADTERRVREHHVELRRQHDEAELRHLAELTQRDANHAADLERRSAEHAEDLRALEDLREQNLASLRRALESRDVIGQAKGIIMAAIGATADEAFALLVKQSQGENRKLTDVAADLAALASRRRRSD